MMTSPQSQDSVQNFLAMVLALFRVNVENLPFVLREAGTVMQHHAIYQSSRSDGRDVEGLLAFGFPDGRTEISQSPDDGIIHHQHGSGLLVCPGYTDDRFIYVSFLAASICSCSSSMLRGIWPFLPLSSHLSSSSR